jgi:glycosyltransferase involved in cell wall biosynthesis
MKRLLIVDLVSPKGHYLYNKNLLTALSGEYCIDFIGDKNLIKWVTPKVENINFLTFTSVKKGQSILKFKIEQLLRLREVIELNKYKSYDAILFSSYDTLTLSFFSEKHFNCEVFLVNHNNLSRVHSLVRKMLFKKVYLSFTGHLLFENIFKENMEKKLKISLDKCHVIPHFIVDDILSIHKNNNKERLKILYLGNDRDNKGLDVLVSAVNLFDSKNWMGNLEITVAGKLSKTYNSRRIKFKNYRISDNEYKELLKETDFVVLPYRDSFSNRVSGIFFEALSYEKAIIASDIDIFKQYFDVYGDIGYLFKEGDCRSLFNLLLDLQEKARISNIDFSDNLKMMKKEYSSRKIRKSLKELIG